MRGTRQSGVRRATSSPSCGLFVSHGQSRSENQENRSEIKAIHAGPGQARAAGEGPQGAEKEPGQTGAEARGQGGRASKPAADAAKSGKWVFTFGDGKAEGKAGLRDLLGGKGANLAEMANLGLPVPPGFTIPTSVCSYFYAHNKTYPAALKAQVEKALDHVGKLAGKAFRRLRKTRCWFRCARAAAPRCRA